MFPINSALQKQFVYAVTSIINESLCKVTNPAVESILRTRNDSACVLFRCVFENICIVVQQKERIAHRRAV